MSDNKTVRIFVSKSRRVVRLENNQESEGYATVKLSKGEKICPELWAIFLMNPHRFEIIESK
jgi:hypothetical protein|tara:strand:+ start:780 stop:965 length:186 start_codon:yes stop_codon:yes gene_type:complete